MVTSTKNRSGNEGNYTFPLLIWWAATSLLHFPGRRENALANRPYYLAMILLTGWDWDKLLNGSTGRKSASNGRLSNRIAGGSYYSFASGLAMVLGIHPPFKVRPWSSYRRQARSAFSRHIPLQRGWYGLSALRLGYPGCNRITVLAIFALLAF